MSGVPQKFSDMYIHSITRKKFNEHNNPKKSKKSTRNMRQDLVNDSFCAIRARTRATKPRQDVVNDMIFELRGIGNPNNVEFTGFTYFAQTKSIPHGINISQITKRRPRIFPTGP